MDWSLPDPSQVAQPSPPCISGTEGDGKNLHCLDAITSYHLKKNSLPGWKTIFSAADLPRTCNGIALLCQAYQSAQKSLSREKWVSSGLAHTSLRSLDAGATVNIGIVYSAAICFSYLPATHPLYIISWPFSPFLVLLFPALLFSV